MWLWPKNTLAAPLTLHATGAAPNACLSVCLSGCLSVDRLDILASLNSSKGRMPWQSLVPAASAKFTLTANAAVVCAVAGLTGQPCWDVCCLASTLHMNDS